MSHSGFFEREYFCHKCHLQYAGGMMSIGGREPCPNCGASNPCAVDTFAHCYCWISNPDIQKRNTARGRNPFKETAWWREEWMAPEWVDLYRTFDLPHEPRPDALKYWHGRERDYLRRRFKKLAAPQPGGDR